MKHIKITWKAFGESPIHDEYITSVEFDLDTKDSALAICEQVFSDTNRYQGELWNIIEPLLSDNRTHTALSVGDEVTINNRTFLCASIGWDELEQENS